MVEYKCNRCSKTFSLKIDYTRHLNRKRPCIAHDTNDIHFECTNCGNLYESQRCLNRHMNRSCKIDKLDEHIINESIKKEVDEHIIDASIKKEVDDKIIDESIKKEVYDIKQVPTNNIQHTTVSSNQPEFIKPPDTWTQFVNYVNDIIEKCPYILSKQKVHEYVVNKFSKELQFEKNINNIDVQKL